MKNKEIFIGIYLLIIYIVGIVGIALPLHDNFVLLTPLNLVVSLILVFICQKDWSKRLIFAMISVYLVGFFAEALGVNTGKVFGDYYTYGEAMGFKLLETPLTAGLLWIIVTIGAAALVNYFLVEKNFIIKSIIGAIFLVVLDFLIEPIAIKLNFWRWKNEIVPIQNYISWYCIGIITLSIFNYLVPKFRNNLAIVLLVVQFLFFGILNLIL